MKNLVLDIVLGFFLAVFILALVGGCGIVYSPQYDAEYEPVTIVDVPIGTPIDVEIPTINTGGE